MKKKLGLGVLCGAALGWSCGAPSDSEIAQAVENHLRSDAQLASDAIEASVTDGKVTLLGSVDSPAERDHAKFLAETVNGVRDVQNDLTVKLEPATPPAVSTPPPAETPAEIPETAPEAATSAPAPGATPDLATEKAPLP